MCHGQEGPDRSHDQRRVLGKGQDTEGANTCVCDLKLIYNSI